MSLKLRGLMTISGWHGASAYHVEIVGYTPKKTRIRALSRMKLAGRNRWLDAGETALVPRTAVQVTGGPRELESTIEVIRRMGGQVFGS